jgi:hypothetical protein
MLFNEMKQLKFISFTDTDIDSILETFTILKNSINDDNFKKYIELYYKIDIINHSYDQDKLLFFCDSIISFIETKKYKLRVKTGLKLNKDKISDLIFGDANFQSEDILFWINVLYDYNFSKHEVYENLENMTDSYIGMYSEYISKMEQSHINDNDVNIEGDVYIIKNKYEEEDSNINEDVTQD